MQFLCHAQNLDLRVVGGAAVVADLALWATHALLVTVKLQASEPRSPATSRPDLPDWRCGGVQKAIMVTFPDDSASNGQVRKNPNDNKNQLRS